MCYILFVVNNVLAVLLSVFVSDIAFGERSALRRFFAVVVTFPIVVFFSVFVLALIGQLTAIALAVLLGGFCGFFAVLDWRISKVRLRSLSTEPGWLFTPKVKRLFFCTGLIISVATGLFVGRFILEGTCFGPDGLSYHSTFAAQRVVSKSLSICVTHYQAHYPFNAEILSTWFMLPFHNDSMVSLVGYYWLALMSVAIVFLLSSLHISTFGALFTVVIAVFSPVLQGTVKSFSAVDLAGPVMVLTAVIFALPLDKDRSANQRFADAVYSGLAAGFATGIKVSFMPICIILFLWFALSEFKVLSLRVRVKILLIFTVSSLLTGGFWYLRNFYLTGNPIFPASSALFAGPFPPERLHRTKLIFWILDNPTNLEQWKYLIKAHMNWPASLFLLSASGYIGSVCSILRKGISRDDKKASACFLLVVVGLVFCALYPLVPFSATSTRYEMGLIVRIRYCVLQFIIGVILFSFLIEKSGRLNLIWFCIAVLALALRWGFRTDKIILTAGVLAILKTASFAWHRYVKNFFVRVPVKRTVIVIYLSASLVGLLAFYPYQKKLTDRKIFDHGKHDFPIGLAWSALEQLPAGSSVTTYGTCSEGRYPCFGRRLHLKPVITEQDGVRRKPLYVYWKTMPEKAIFKKSRRMDEEIPESQLARLVDNLITGGIEYVLVSKWRTGQWPVQQPVLAASERAKKIYDDGYSVIWHLTDEFESDKPELRK
jgi:hypothetical protein